MSELRNLIHRITVPNEYFPQTNAFEHAKLGRRTKRILPDGSYDIIVYNEVPRSPESRA